MLLVRLLVLIICVLASVASAGCAKESAIPTQTQTVPPTVQPTVAPSKTPTVTAGPYGELRIGLGSFQMENLDHVRGSYGDMVHVWAPMLEWMFRLNGAEMVPGVIENWELASDGLSWTYIIRKGIQFHDGQSLTAKDVKFSLERFASKDARLADLRTAIDHIDIIDDNTVRIYTLGKQPFLPFLNTFYSPGYGVVMPKDYIEQHGIDYYTMHPVGAGPFKFVRHIGGDLVEYEGFEQHWRQAPSFKKLSIVLIPEETTRMAMVKTGSVDIVDVGIESAAEAETLGFKTMVTRGEMTHVNLYGTYDPRAQGMPTTDIRVRQALSLAINRDEIKNTIFYGMLSPPTPPYVPSAAVVDADIPYWKEYAAKLFRYDPEEAKRLLNEAGYPNGFTIRLYAANQSGVPFQQKLAEVIQGYWNKIGIKGQLIPMDWGGLKPMLQPRPVAECVGQAAMASYGDVMPVLVRSLASGFHGTTMRNYALVDTAMPELDKLLNDAIVEIDIQKRKELLAKAIKISADSYTALMIGTAPGLGIIGSQVDIEFPKPAQAIALWVEFAKHRN